MLFLIVAGVNRIYHEWSDGTEYEKAATQKPHCQALVQTAEYIKNCSFTSQKKVFISESRTITKHIELGFRDSLLLDVAFVA